MINFNEVLIRLDTPAGMAMAITHVLVFAALCVRGYVKKHGWGWQAFDPIFTQDWLYQVLPAIFTLMAVNVHTLQAAIFIGALSGMAGKGFASVLRGLIIDREVE